MRVIKSTCSLFGNALRSYSTKTATTVAVDKHQLKALRQKTGYSLSNCKQALQQFGDDMVSAEKWLDDLAKKQGWAKVSKLENRSAVQGLIGVTVQGNYGAMVELNCETDFVAKNDLFRDLVQVASEAALALVSRNDVINDRVDRISINIDELSKTNITTGPLEDLVAYTIGRTGERMVLKSALGMHVGDGLKLVGYSHPRDSGGPASAVKFGRYGALLACRALNPAGEPLLLKVAEQVCQHVIGLSPNQIGNIPTKQDIDQMKQIRLDAVSIANANERQRETQALADDESEVEEKEIPSWDKPNEKRLLWQPFIVCPDLSVAEFLLERDVEIVDFVRIKCGDSVS